MAMLFQEQNMELDRLARKVELLEQRMGWQAKSAAEAIEHAHQVVKMQDGYEAAYWRGEVERLQERLDKLLAKIDKMRDTQNLLISELRLARRWNGVWKRAAKANWLALRILRG